MSRLFVVLIFVMMFVMLYSCSDSPTPNISEEKDGSSVRIRDLDGSSTNTIIPVSNEEKNTTPDSSTNNNKEPDMEIIGMTELPASSFLPEIPRISVHDVKEKIDAGINILILDTRGTKYYEESHIVGAVLLTAAEFIPDLDDYDEITTYCT